MGLRDRNIVFRDSGSAIYIDQYDYPPASDLWIFSFPTQKWTKIENLQFDAFDFGSVLTSNEHYIVLLGGAIDTGQQDVDDIFILDIRNEDESKWKFRKSSIKCPEDGECHAVRTGGVDSKDDILVNGFIKECFKMKEFDNIQLPPSHIIKMIAMWYSAEMIHWLNRFE